MGYVKREIGMNYADWKREMDLFLTVGISNYRYATMLLHEILSLSSNPENVGRVECLDIFDGGDFYIKFDGLVVNIDLRLKVSKKRMGDFRSNYESITDDILYENQILELELIMDKLGGDSVVFRKEYR